MSETRKIAAILIADVVGYGRLAGRHRLHARLGERSSAARRVSQSEGISRAHVYPPEHAASNRAGPRQHNGVRLQ
jgi:hypothetical protein